MVERRYPPARTCSSGAATGRSMFVLAEGLVEILVTPEDGGAARAVAQRQPGQPIGEMSLLTGGRRSATARALTEVIAFEIAREHLEPLLESHPGLAGALSWLVAERSLQRGPGPAREDRRAGEAQETQRLSEQILTRMRAPVPQRPRQPPGRLTRRGCGASATSQRSREGRLEGERRASAAGHDGLAFVERRAVDRKFTAKGVVVDDGAEHAVQIAHQHLAVLYDDAEMSAGQAVRRRLRGSRRSNRKSPRPFRARLALARP